MAETLIDRMIERGAISRQDRDLYVYAAKTIAADLVTFVPILAYCLLSGRFVLCLLFVVAFGVLRRFAGGYHAPHLYLCVLLSLIERSKSMRLFDLYKPS